MINISPNFSFNYLSHFFFFWCWHISKLISGFIMTWMHISLRTFYFFNIITLSFSLKKKNYFLLSFQLCRVCMWTFSGCGKAGAALLCSAQTYRGGLSFCGTWALGAQASVVVVPGLSCSETCGTFPDQESNLCLCIGRQILSHRTTREVHLAIFYP